MQQKIQIPLQIWKIVWASEYRQMELNYDISLGPKSSWHCTFKSK